MSDRHACTNASLYAPFGGSTFLQWAGRGFVSIVLDLVDKPLPSRERSDQIARNFLCEAAPDLRPRMRVTSIAPHGEPLCISRAGRSETVQLPACSSRHATRRTEAGFGGIVDGDGKPMLLERDLQWSNLCLRRTTGECLHDRWIQKQEEARAPG